VNPAHASREPIFAPVKPIPAAISSGDDVPNVAKKNRCSGAGTTERCKEPLALLPLLSPRKLMESEAGWVDDNGGDEDGCTRLAIEMLGERRAR
jgi:hypothetical protein